MKTQNTMIQCSEWAAKSKIGAACCIRKRRRSQINNPVILKELEKEENKLTLKASRRKEDTKTDKR